jgi:hypothetical protein
MATTTDLNPWNDGTDPAADARLLLGVVMAATALAIGAAMYAVGPALGAKVAALMLPVLLVTVLRTPLDGCSVYGSRPPRL